MPKQTVSVNCALCGHLHNGKQRCFHSYRSDPDGEIIVCQCDEPKTTVLPLTALLTDWRNAAVECREIEGKEYAKEREGNRMAAERAQQYASRAATYERCADALERALNGAEQPKDDKPRSHGDGVPMPKRAPYAGNVEPAPPGSAVSPKATEQAEGRTEEVIALINIAREFHHNHDSGQGPCVRCAADKAAKALVV